MKEVLIDSGMLKHFENDNLELGPELTYLGYAPVHPTFYSSREITNEFFNEENNPWIKVLEKLNDTTQLYYKKNDNHLKWGIPQNFYH